MTDNKTFYVTTSIPYVNGLPHLGHAMEFVMADALARYNRQQGKSVLFSIGTDEHGSKIAEKALESGKEPKAFVDEMSVGFRQLAKDLYISNDRFIRTTDSGHEARAQLVWKALEKYIYKGKYEGWYCTGCESYVTDKIVKLNGGQCPDHNRAYEKLAEENYFFKLSQFASNVQSKIADDSFLILPKSRKNEILQVFQEGLEDISISRPKDKISWGIGVPGDSKQVMYVWFEALMNYITVLGYPEHEDFKKFWPANVQVIGKDILRFHAAIWPAMLLALELPLAEQLYVHGHINVDGQKMSKSLGNSILPSDIIAKHGTDAFRYYILRHVPSYDDGDFSWRRFEEVYNNELANELGNAVSRTVAMINKYQKGVIGDMPEPEHDYAQYEDAMSLCKFDRALDEVWEQVRGLNQYVDEEKPWILAKNNDDTHLREVLAYMVSCLLEISHLLQPFMPDTAEKIRLMFESGVVRPLEGNLFPKIVE